MGFTIYYRSTEPITSERESAIRSAAADVNEGRTWLSCEPVDFFLGTDDGHLLGGSKPNFLPNPDEAAEAAAEGLPDGTISDLLDALCKLSRTYHVDWEFSHDESAGPIGYVRNGKADPALRNVLSKLSDAVAAILDDVDPEEAPFGIAAEPDGPRDEEEERDDDEPPPTLKIWTE